MAKQMGYKTPAKPDKAEYCKLLSELWQKVILKGHCVRFCGEVADFNQLQTSVWFGLFWATVETEPSGSVAGLALDVQNIRRLVVDRSLGILHTGPLNLLQYGKR